jgi:hypothetical protein
MHKLGIALAEYKNSAKSVSILLINAFAEFNAVNGITFKCVTNL